MTLRSLTPEDIEWAAGLLAQRRAALESAAPILWRPAEDTEEFFGTWIQESLQLGGHGFRTDDSVLIAGLGDEGLVVDDSVVAGNDWEGAGAALWSELTKVASGQRVRFVCPAAEPERSRFAVLRAMDLVNTWWLHEVGAEGGEPGQTIELAGADAATVATPPGFDARGPILLVRDAADPAAAIAAAPQRAHELGCSAVIVCDNGLRTELAEALNAQEFRPHCLFFETDL